MFDADWSLRVGPEEMGGFTKDWLAEKKDADQPGSGSRDTGAGGSGASAGSGAGGASGTGGDPGTDRGVVDCGTHGDAQSCDADGVSCYWGDPDCNHATGYCAFKGGLPSLCP